MPVFRVSTNHRHDEVNYLWVADLLSEVCPRVMDTFSIVLQLSQVEKSSSIFSIHKYLSNDASNRENIHGRLQHCLIHRVLCRGHVRSESFRGNIASLVVVQFSKVQVIGLQIILRNESRLKGHLIGEEQVAERSYQNVARLYITMHHFDRMHLRDSAHKLKHEPLLLHEAELRNAM